MSRFGAAVRPASEVQDWMSIATGGTASTPVSGYQRPSDWLPLPTVVAGEQKIVGIVAIRSTGVNRLAVKIWGAYTVDWGDGSAPANYSSGTIGSHAYTWADIPASTLTTHGYRQVVVTITMQAAQTMTHVHFDAAHPSAIYTSHNRWLDVRMAGASVTNLTVNSLITSEDGWCEDIERFDYVGNNAITDFFSAFHMLGCLRQVVNLYTGAATDTSSMFEDCGSLLSVPAFNLASVTDASYMFDNCFSLQHVPAFTMNTTTAMNCTEMFSGCGGVKTVGALNLSKVEGRYFMPELWVSLQSYAATGSRICLDLSDLELTASELNTIYTDLATISDVNRTISTATVGTSDPIVATFTTTASHGWIPGQYVTVAGISPANFNGSGQIRSVPASNQFTLALSAYPRTAYVSGGSVTHDTRVDVHDTDGAASDNPAIATAKGWTVIS